jgi:hypothetical protein
MLNGDGTYTPNANLSAVDVRSPRWLAQSSDTDIGAVAAGYIAVTPWIPANVGLLQPLAPPPPPRLRRRAQ